MLVLDDLHWAKKGTIAILRHVARFVSASCLGIRERKLYTILVHKTKLGRYESWNFCRIDLHGLLVAPS